MQPRIKIILILLVLLLPVAVSAKKSVIVNEQGDTIKHLHPKFNGVTISADIFSPVANLVGQKYGNYEMSIDAGFYNRFYPIYEFGISYANETPDGANYRYKVYPSFYNRVGMNYNILYNKDIPGILYVGLRYGFSFANYEVTDITTSSPYWEVTQTDLTIPRSKSVAHWGELLLGLQVKLYKGLMMGWSVRYKLLFADSQKGDAKQYIIPGFGKCNSPIGFGFTINYRFSPKQKEEIPQIQ